MAYNSTYTTEDVTAVTIDGIVIFAITVVGFVGLIALVILYKFAKKSVK